MRLLPRSLYGRLLALSLVATLAALAFAGVAIGGVLERFVTATVDDRLGDKLIALSGVVRQNGDIDRAYLTRLDRQYALSTDWRIDAPGGTVGSAAIAGTLGISDGNGIRLAPVADYAANRPHPPPPGPAPPTDAAPGAPDPPPDIDGGSHPFDGRLRDGGRIHGRWTLVPTDRGMARIAVALPRDLIDRPVRGALVPLAASLGLLAVALALATLVQLRLGLRPLARLRTSVAAIRAGTAERLPDDQPSELAPLASEVNALVVQNRAQLAQARGHVANLAHGLKTPLATLALGLRADNDPEGRLSAEVTRIDQAIRHHLGRARTDNAGGIVRAAVPLAPAVTALAEALARIHADRGVAFAADVPADLALAIDPQDLDELLGNLLDNGWRWACTRLSLAATREAAGARIAIADDGPGIPAEARAAALAPGRRLDESGDGHGFGLSIARELAELHGGALDLAETPGGGLTAIVTLPAAPLSARGVRPPDASDNK